MKVVNVLLCTVLINDGKNDITRYFKVIQINLPKKSQNGIYINTDKLTKMWVEDVINDSHKGSKGIP